MSPGVRFVNGATHNTIRYCELINGGRSLSAGDDEADRCFRNGSLMMPVLKIFQRNYFPAKLNPFSFAFYISAYEQAAA